MFLHGSYAIRLVINNEAFIVSCVQGQNLKVNRFIVTNNAFHNLTLPLINKLVIVHLEKIPNVKLFLVQLQNFAYFLKFSNNTSYIIRSLMPTSKGALDEAYLLWSIHNVVITKHRITT
jgi:hypothetical protein